MILRPTITVLADPSLELFPSQRELFIRITAPTLLQATPPPLDLVIALDTSGSMRGLPLELAREAAAQVYAHRGDAHLGLVHFGSVAQVAAPLQVWKSDNGFRQALASLTARGSTALHAGWHLATSLLTAPLGSRDQVPHRLQRVLLLTDGRANIGPRRPAELAAEIRRALTQGVSTSTVGVGQNYDELLLETLAGEGDGTYHYAETPEELIGLFLSELESLKATFGRLVSLGINGGEVVEVLNDLPRLPNGRLALPPLQAGHSLDLLLRIRVNGHTPLRFRLAWTGLDGRRHVEHLEVSPGELSRRLTPEEQREFARLRGTLLLARQQRQIAQLTDRGYVERAFLRLGEARGQLQALQAQGLNVQDELHQLEHLQARLDRGERRAASKLARKESYLTSTGRKGKG